MNGSEVVGGTGVVANVGRHDDRERSSKRKNGAEEGSKEDELGFKRG